MPDREKVIKGLEFTKAMITFNPSTGEDIEPENLNEANKTTYDACVGAIALLKEQKAVVRCFDCKHFQWGDADDETIFCGLHGRCYRWDFFCADWERKEGR